MALTKNRIVDNIIAETGFSKKKSVDTVEKLLEIIKKTMASGDDVLITGFGKFCVKTKNQRKGRNPASGEELMLPSRKVVVFKCSGKLREKINNKRN